MFLFLLIWVGVFSWLHWELCKSDSKMKTWGQWFKTVTGRAAMLVFICIVVLFHFLITTWEEYGERRDG